MNTELYLNQVAKSINKYCKSKNLNFDYNQIFDFYILHLNGAYLDFKIMDVIYQFKNELQYIKSLNL